MVLFTAISCGHQKQNFIFWREFFENSFERKNQLLLVITFWINHFLNSNMKSHIQEWFCLLLFRLPMQPQPIVKPIRLGNYVNKNREKRIFWLKIPPFFNCQDYWKPNWKRTKRRRMEGHTSVYWAYGRGIWNTFSFFSENALFQVAVKKMKISNSDEQIQIKKSVDVLSKQIKHHNL